MPHRATRRARRTPELRMVAAERRLAEREGVTTTVERIPLPLTGTTLRMTTMRPSRPAAGTGADDGPVTLLVHGVTLSSAWWLPLAAHLPGRVVAVDLPGHGLSDGVDLDRHDVREVLVATVAAVRAALRVDRLTVVGNSLGGMVGLWTALDAPGTVDRLVLLGAPGVALAGGEVDPLLGALSVPPLARLLLAGRTPPAVYGAAVARSIAEPSLRRRPDLVAAAYWASRRAAFRRTVPRMLVRALSYRTPRPDAALTDADLARVDVPVLYLHGHDERYLPVPAARRAVERMPDAHLSEVEGGHVPWLADPAALALLVAHPVGETTASVTGTAGTTRA